MVTPHPCPYRLPMHRALEPGRDHVANSDFGAVPTLDHTHPSPKLGHQHGHWWLHSELARLALVNGSSACFLLCLTPGNTGWRVDSTCPGACLSLLFSGVT